MRAAGAAIGTARCRLYRKSIPTICGTASAWRLADSLPIIGALLGHADSATTRRYAHLSADPLKAAADRIAGFIAGAMNVG